MIPETASILDGIPRPFLAKGHHGKSGNVGDADLVQGRMTAKLNLNDGGREDDIAVVAAAASLDSFDSRVFSLGLFFLLRLSFSFLKFLLSLSSIFLYLIIPSLDVLEHGHH